MATWRQPCAASQRANSRKPAVVVEKRSDSRTTSPEAPVVSRQAVKVFLCTSMPQQTASTTGSNGSMTMLLPEGAGAGESRISYAGIRAIAQVRVPHGVPDPTHVRVVHTRDENDQNP